jgi:hypothetical protein
MSERTSLQAVMSRCLDRYASAHPLVARQRQVCRHVLSCRTAALGGFALECDQCRDPVRLYHACRDRHCPRCQRRASEAWCERERAAVLPVTYHHLVFTLPHTLNGWVALYPREFYGLVFETVWATLAAFAADPKRLGGQLGMTAVLHTWGQALTRHVHLHCLLPGGAFAADGRWRSARSTYLFPVRALSRHFRGGFVSRLRQAVEQGRLPRLDPAQIGPVLDELMRVEWNVYTKPCLGHTETVVNYLGRYTHRIGLSDQRLRALDEGQVQLDYQDHRDGGAHKTMTLSGEELIRRFLLHVLPRGFMRVRHFGFLANRCRAERLNAIRRAIEDEAPTAKATAEALVAALPFDGYPCPKCRQGRLRIVAELVPQRLEGG